MTVCVCLSVCLSVGLFVCLPASISPELHTDLSQIFMHVTYGLLWLHRDMSCISSFMDDVILAYKPRQLNVAVQLIEARPTCSLGLGYKRRVGTPVAGQWTHGPTFRAPQSRSTRPQSACWIFMTSCLHIMWPLCIATQTWRVIKVTP